MSRPGMSRVRELEAVGRTEEVPPGVVVPGVADMRVVVQADRRFEVEPGDLFRSDTLAHHTVTESAEM